MMLPAARGEPFNRCAHCLRTEWTGPPCPHCKYGGVPLNEPPLLPEGARVGSRYVLGRKEGHGGFSICYRAWDCEAEELIAIKELFPAQVAGRRSDGRVSINTTQQADFHTAVEALRHEAEVLRKLDDQPAIVRVRDLFEDNGTVYLAMQHLRGRPYNKYLDDAFAPQGEYLPVATAVDVALVILGALEAVHARGLFHLDIKPPNVRVLDNDRIVLLDFGSARDAFRVSRHDYGNTFTPGFAAPEQHRDDDVTAATDVYGVAALLYYSLSLEVPTRAASRENGVPLPPLSSLNPAVPQELEQVIDKAMSLDPAERYPTAREFRKALEQGRRKFNPAPLRPSRSRRMFAGLVDVAASAALLVVIALLGLPPTLGAFVLLWWLLQLLPRLAGATPGMLAVGLKLAPIAESGGAITVPRLLLRTPLLLWTVATGFRSDDQGLMLHDRESGLRPVPRAAA